MRKKLIELIQKADKEDYTSATQDQHYEFMADYLISNGVTMPMLCKDCVHFTEGMAIGMCKRIPGKEIMPIRYDDFCSYGGRRDNG